MVSQSLSRELTDLSPICFKGYIFLSHLPQGLILCLALLLSCRFPWGGRVSPSHTRAAGSEGNNFCPWLGPRPRRYQSLESGSLRLFGVYRIASLCLDTNLTFKSWEWKGEPCVPIKKCTGNGCKSGLLQMLAIFLGCKDLFWQDFCDSPTLQAKDSKCLLLFLSLYCSGFCTIRGMKVFNF